MRCIVNLNLIKACDANVKPISMRLSRVSTLNPARLLVKKAGEWLHFTLSVFGIILRLVFERINAWQPSGMPPPEWSFRSARLRDGCSTPSANIGSGLQEEFFFE